MAFLRESEVLMAGGQGLRKRHYPHAYLEMQETGLRTCSSSSTGSASARCGGRENAGRG